MPIATLKLSPELTQLQDGIDKVLTGQKAGADTSRIVPR